MRQTSRSNLHLFSACWLRSVESFESPPVGFKLAISNALFCSATRIESSDAVIRVYDAAGDVIETHEHTRDFKEP
jgi:hypothetical protein